MFMFCILFIIPLLHVLGYGFCFFNFSLAKFQISSFIRGSFYSFVQLRSYHIFWEICVERDFFVRKAEPRTLWLSFRHFAPESANEKESERASPLRKPFCVDPKGFVVKNFVVKLPNLDFFCLFVCFHIRIGWCIRKEEGRWGSNKLESKNWLVLLVLSPSTDWLIGFNELFFGEREKTKCYRSFCVGLLLLKICLFSYSEIWKS